MADNCLFLKQDDASLYLKGDFDIGSILSGGGGGGGGGSGSSSAPIIFSSTTPVTVANNASATSLFSSGEGDLSIDASSWDAGQEIVYEVSGKYSTADSLAGDLDFIVKIGTALSLTVTMTPWEAQANALYELKAKFVRISEGVSGTVLGWVVVKMWAIDGGVKEGYAVTSSAQTVTSTSSHIPDVQVDWATASASNSITQQLGFVKRNEVRS